MNVPFLELNAAYEELKSDLDAAYQRFMRSGQYVLSSEVEGFEKEYATYCDAKWCVGVSNGLDALHLALRACGIGPRDEVIVPSNTYIATWLAVTQVGATPVPVEPDCRTFNIDPAQIDKAVGPATRAIIPVNLYGQPVDYDSVIKIALRYGLRIIVDNAQAHGARYKSKRVGGLADVECHSFYPTKNLGAFGEAGAITTNDDEVSDRVRVLRNYGSRIRYHNEVAGYNSRLDELQAAFLRVKLRRLDDWNARRRSIANMYLNQLDGSNGLILPTTLAWTEPVWYLFVVRHPSRDALQAALKEAGITTLIHYPVPPHLSSAYKDSGFKSGAFPVAEQLAASCLSLPVGPHMSDEQINAVVNAVQEFCDSSR